MFRLALAMFLLPTSTFAQGKVPFASFLAVNPGSLLASKMVKEGFGIAGNDLSIGADILRRAALDPDFANVSGHYFVNDAGNFGRPHHDARDPAKIRDVVDAIKATSSRLLKHRT